MESYTQLELVNEVLRYFEDDLSKFFVNMTNNELEDYIYQPLNTDDFITQKINSRIKFFHPQYTVWQGYMNHQFTRSQEKQLCRRA